MSVLVHIATTARRGAGLGRASEPAPRALQTRAAMATDESKWKSQRRSLLSAKLAALPALFVLLSVGAPAQITAPAMNWALPVFTKEGFRLMTARGTEARATTDRRFEVVDLNLTFFTGDASNQVDAVILSPAATFQPDDKIAHGENRVRYIRDDLEASGIRWIYNHGDKKISLDGNVRVTFRAEIKDLLR